MLGPSPQSVVFRQRCHSSPQATREVLKCLIPSTNPEAGSGVLPEDPHSCEPAAPRTLPRKTQGMFGKGLGPAFSWASSWRKEESRAERTSSGSPKPAQPARGHLSGPGAAQGTLTPRCVRLLCTLRRLWPRGQGAVTRPAGPQPAHQRRVLLHRTALGRFAPKLAPNPPTDRQFLPRGPSPVASCQLCYSRPASPPLLLPPQRAQDPAELIFPRHCVQFTSSDLTANFPTAKEKEKKKNPTYTHHLECLKMMTCSFLPGISISSPNHQHKAKIPGGNAL